MVVTGWQRAGSSATVVADTVKHARFSMRAGLSIALLAGTALAFNATRAGATPALDHFMFYKNTRMRACVGGGTPGALCTTSTACAPGKCGSASYSAFGPVQLTDQFRTLDYKVISPPELGLPADKNGEGVVNPSTHLRQHLVKPFARCVGGSHPGTACLKGTDCGAGGSCSNSTLHLPKTTVRIVNQCSDALLDVTAPATALLVPANKSLTDPVAAPDGSVDHFLCYNATLKTRLANGTVLPKFPAGIQVDVTDQFQTRRYDLLKITRLCNPVAKQEDPLLAPILFKGNTPQPTMPKPITPAAIGNPSAHLVCYAAKVSHRQIAQNGCGPLSPTDHGTPISQPKSTAHIGVYVNDQFGPDRLKINGGPIELCIPSSKNICGNGVAESPEACDGADDAACNGLSCRSDCTCTPATCGNNIQEGTAEACDGTDDAACGGVACRPDCSCTPGSCGDNIVNQPNEVCDGTADSACPGQCDGHCLCPGPACSQDPTRTIYSGPPGLGCFTFNGDQATCLSTYEMDSDTHLSQCLYYTGTGKCLPCDADTQLGKDCTNTCNCGNGVLEAGEECDGADDTACPGACLSDCRCAPPPCTQAPARTFTGWLNSNGCAYITDQTACEGAFETDGGRALSCYFQGGCAACNSSAQSGDACVNVCACGNNVVDPGEDCDGTDPAGACTGSACGADCRCLP